MVTKTDRVLMNGNGGKNTIEVQQLAITPSKFFYLNNEKAKRIQIAMFEHRKAGDHFDPSSCILELVTEHEEQFFPNHQFIRSSAVFNKISPAYQTVKECSSHAKELICDWIYTRIGTDGKLLPTVEDGPWNVVIDEPDHNCLGTLPILPRNSPPLSRKGSISPPSVSMRKSIDCYPSSMILSGNTLEELRLKAVKNIEKLYPTTTMQITETALDMDLILQEQQQQPFHSLEIPIQRTPFSTPIPTLQDDQPIYDNETQSSIPPQPSNIDNNPSTSALFSSELLSELKKSLSPKHFPLNILPKQMVTVAEQLPSEPFSSESMSLEAPTNDIRPVTPVPTSTVISSSSSSSPISSLPLPSSLPASSIALFDAIWGGGGGGNNANTATRGVRKYPPRKPSPIPPGTHYNNKLLLSTAGGRTGANARMTFVVPMAPRVRPKNASLQPDLSTYFETDEEEGCDDNDEEHAPLGYPSQGDLSNWRSLIEQARIEAIKAADADIMMVKYANSPRNSFPNEYHLHIDAKEASSLPTRGIIKGTTLVPTSSSVSSPTTSGSPTRDVPSSPIASPPSHPRPSRRQITRGGFRFRIQSTSNGHADVSEGCETWKDAGEDMMDSIHSSSSPHQPKEHVKEWACDIMKRLIESGGGDHSDVNDSDEDEQPQVLRSVTQDLPSTLELEEQPPMVGRAHTSEF